VTILKIEARKPNIRYTQLAMSRFLKQIARHLQTIVYPYAGISSKNEILEPERNTPRQSAIFN